MAKGDNNQQMGHTGFMPQIGSGMNNQMGNGGMVPNMMPSNNPSQMQSMMPSSMLMHAIGQHMMNMNNNSQPGMSGQVQTNGGIFNGGLAQQNPPRAFGQ